MLKWIVETSVTGLPFASVATGSIVRQYRLDKYIMLWLNEAARDKSPVDAEQYAGGKMAGAGLV